jgi:predicted nuclease with TOPRIM domain
MFTLADENARLQKELEQAQEEMQQLKEKGKGLAKDLASSTRRRRDEVVRLREQLSQLAPTREQYTSAYVLVHFVV